MKCKTCCSPILAILKNMNLIHEVVPKSPTEEFDIKVTTFISSINTDANEALENLLKFSKYQEALTLRSESSDICLAGLYKSYLVEGPNKGLKSFLRFISNINGNDETLVTQAQNQLSPRLSSFSHNLTET